ncbi:Uncharacterised protein [Vibrio cholerae]|nr:Uncharacterised protein [Vibrio cholerae]CSB64881.1 Uncharacterised protein [Vibrio cholerae]
MAPVLVLQQGHKSNQGYAPSRFQPPYRLALGYRLKAQQDPLLP